MDSNAEAVPSPEFPSLAGLREYVVRRLPALTAQPRVTSPEGGYALPDASLVLLRDLIGELGVQQVFEFGSGRSTKLFLNCGCHVTVVEDSAHWLRCTMMSLSWELRVRFKSAHCRLDTVFDDGAPFLGWRLSGPMREALRAADLVLVDSPAYPPFREHALVATLRQNRRGLVVLDDANIPTVERFCVRLAGRNGLAMHRTRMDHGLCFVCPPAEGQRLVSERGALETLKAWRRYLLGSRHCYKPKTTAVPT
jgi:hypothetical protein